MSEPDPRPRRAVRVVFGVATILFLSVVVAVAIRLRNQPGPTAAQEFGVAVTAEQRGPGPTDDVAVVGDSITQIGAPVLTDGLGDEWVLSVRALGGQTLGQMERDTVELAEAGPEQAIVNLGSNDVLHDVDLDASVEDLHRTVGTFEAAGTRCIHLVTINESMEVDGIPDPAARARRLNDEMEALAADRPDVDLIRWNDLVEEAASSGDPVGGLTYDTIHPTTEGQERLVAAYADALSACPG